MAYAATTSISTQTISGRRHFFVTITETEAGTASEWSLSELPRLGTVVHWESHITAGSGSTLQPKLGKETAWTVDTVDHVYTQADARSLILSDAAIRYDLSGATDPQTLYGVSGVDSGSDNSITTKLIIVEGHEVPAHLADSSGNLLTSLGTKIAGEDLTNDRMKVEHQYSYARISTATTTVVKSGAGFLHTLTVNSTAAGTITIYDNTAGSGTIIAQLKASVAECSFIYDVSFSTGLTIVTGAASGLTVSYR